MHKGLLVVAMALPAGAVAAPGDVIRSLDAPGDSASGLGWDGASLWVSNLRTAAGGGEDRVYELDPRTGEVRSSFAMPAGSFYHGIAFDADGNLFTDDLYTEIVHLDRRGNELNRFDAQGLVYGVATDPVQRVLYQVDTDTRTLYALDPANGREIRDVALELRDEQGTAGLAWDGSRLWVVGLSTATIYRVDADTGAVLARFDAPGPQPEGLAWDGACLWLSDTAADRIEQVDHGQPDLPACPVMPPPDAAVSDAAVPDAAVSDAAVLPDAAVPDAARMPMDGTPADAGGIVDATPDGGPPDAASPDAARADAAPLPDGAATPDAAPAPDAAARADAAVDRPPPDATAGPDATPDASAGIGAAPDDDGCACQTSTAPLPALLALLALVRPRRRRHPAPKISPESRK